MTVLEFWGCGLIAFGPALALFSLTIARDPVKVILLIASSFFWLISYLIAAMCWSVVSQFCNYLIIGAYLAILSQETFRYLFHLLTKKALLFLGKIIDAEAKQEAEERGTRQSQRANEIQLNDNRWLELQNEISTSYVSGLGFGLMSGAFALMNVLTDHLGPGTVGLKGDSAYFLLVSSLTTLAFILLNVSWSILMSASFEKSDQRLATVVLLTHVTATTITFINRYHLQLVSVLVIYLLTILCGVGAFHVTGLNVSKLATSVRSRMTHSPSR